MKGLLAIFKLELLSLVRSKALVLMTAGCVAWMLALPRFLRGDGTPEGTVELYVRYSLGGAFALVALSLVASATAAVARERAEKRLQLTMVRPVGYFTIALAKIAALTAAGALALGVAVLTLAVRTATLGGPAALAASCSHVLKPVLESPRAEAERMYEEYIRDPETPEPVRKAPKAVVVRLLTQRALDHYQTIATNETAVWRFAVEGIGLHSPDSPVAVRLRFTNLMELRQDVLGEFRLGGRQGAVSNITQAVLTVPLSGRGRLANELSFANRGKGSLMLRPRRDVDLLLPADAFAWNLLRTYLELLAVLAALVAFGVFLGTALARPVALFTAVVILLVGMMSPSVIEQYPDQLETKLADRLALWLTRSVERVTRPVASLSPLEALSRGECVERSEVAWALAVDALAVPMLLALLSAMVMPRKQEEI